MSAPERNAPDHYAPHRYEVRHETAYTYELDVTSSFGRACLRPRETAYQRILTHEISVSPEPDVLDEHTDLFGNHSHYVEIQTPHTSLVVTKRSTVLVEFDRVDLDGLNAMTVAEAAAAVAADETVDPLERAIFSLPSELVELSPPVHAFAQTLLWPERGLGDAIRAMYHDIYTDFTYSKGATSVKTTLPELLESRAGVCQDFAHLAVGCFRAVGLPARYVSGYIETYAPPGQQKLAGSDATHAWASVMIPGGRWVDLDPTNDHLADSRYITTAWGRDFRDVSPLKGVIFTEGKRSTLKVGVDVIPIPDPTG
ncbi:transglutaminase family protein [Propioniciclava soli]|uniref:Transglutaminase family protein n=1 Tax=Propioniciclava soli TaxID=2775081 RepID=A0ABZ3CEZ2_9ACTN|nr:transglutaminase family protein [Propioniciclava soli]